MKILLATALGLVYLAMSGAILWWVARPVAIRAQQWWTGRGEVAEVPEDMSTEELWEAIDTALSDRSVVDRRFKALVKAQRVPLYRRIPRLRARLGAGRRPS